VQEYAAAGADSGDEALAPAQQIFRRPGHREQEIDVFALLVFGDEEVSVFGVIGQSVVHGGKADNRPQCRVGSYIFYSFAQAVHCPAVIQAFEILFHRSNHVVTS
jgi:hypothetical protein